jgi:predicted helicase
VRSVDELLRTEFGLVDGLADTTSWGEMAKRRAEFQIPEGVDPGQALVQILDPATGTGTFLVEVIDLIHKTLLAKWKAQDHGEKKIGALWNEYVPKHLLPRLHGYELLMAPYAIAHLKIGLKLYETGYRFGSDERAQIYLTNALEPASDVGQMRLEGILPALAHEAQAVNEVKRRQRFLVVIGNPPYSGNSSNRGEWIESLINDYRKVDGKPLGEVKVWLKDDYVKFLRFAEHSIGSTGVGLLGFITNNSYFDGLTFRGMRHHLVSNSAHGYFLNLHGNGNLRERSPDGSPDENVFDILQGVGITLLVKWGTKPRSPLAYLGDVFGTRETKYARLVATRAVGRDFLAAQPRAPNYFVVRHDEDSGEYEKFTSITQLWEIGGLGFQSHRDKFVVAMSIPELTKRMQEFFDLCFSDREVQERFEIDDYRRFIVRKFRRENKFDNTAIQRIQYRPFDYRYIYYARDIVQEWQIRFHGHLLKPNLGLNVMRQTKAPSWHHVMVSSTPTPAVFVEIKDGSSQFPLYQYAEFEESLLATKGTRSQS